MEINKDKLNVIAFYLPQFHEIEENNKAYGKGFTEWTNVKKARPLFEGHNQPRVPLNQNYYCLLDGGRTMLEQAKLAKEHGLFGFCYYHYWFKNGKKLLEKPLEEMLANKAIDMPFCLCWANENWTKRWDGGNNEVIVEQDYDDLGDIKNHVDYLSSFLKDDRYITLNGKPLLIIYKPELIPNLKQYLDEMKRCFKLHSIDVCFASQFPQYFFEGKNLSFFDYYLQFEPMFSMQANKEKERPMKRFLKKTLKLLHLYSFAQALRNKKPQLEHRDYDEVWKANLEYKVTDSKMIAGSFVDWDNTPRKKAGLVFDGTTPDKFAHYFGQLKRKIEMEYSLPLVFINAWNEWGEGAYLEPDELHGFDYLEAIKKTVGH